MPFHPRQRSASKPSFGFQYSGTKRNFAPTSHSAGKRHDGPDSLEILPIVSALLTLPQSSPIPPGKSRRTRCLKPSQLAHSTSQLRSIQRTFAADRSQTGLLNTTRKAQASPNSFPQSHPPRCTQAASNSTDHDKKRIPEKNPAKELSRINFPNNET